MQAGQKIQSHSSMEIVRLLGEGGFGRVYLVKKTFLNGLLPRFFALKCFHKNVGMDSMMAEARALFEVRSHHCVGVHSVEEFEGGCGLLLEYVEGVTLEDLGKNFRLSFEEQASIVLQIKKGLADLFAVDLTHGDLTPRNIMIDKNGRVVLLDFGLPSTFAEGVVVGAFDYLSESRKSGKPPTTADDFFALDLISFDLQNSLIGQKKPPRQLITLESADQIFKGGKEKPPSSLKSKVQQLLTGRDHTVRTKIFGDSQSFAFLRLINFLFILALLPVTQASTRQIGEALLAIRSLNWIEVQMWDGRTLSSSQEGLKIPSGKHILKWQTAKKTGIKSIEVDENEKLILGDSDFN